MGLETGTYISDLVVTNPAAGDGIVDADNHMRLIKSTVKATFPNVTGAVNPTHTELNFVDGVTSAIQTQLGAKAASGLTTASGLTIPTDKLAGRDTAATGALEDIGVTGGIEFTGTGSIQTSAFTGDVTKAAGGTSTTYTITASATVAGKVELLTDAEAQALTDTSRAMTAANLKAAAAGKKAIWIDAGAMRQKVTNGADFSDYDSGSNDVTLRCADFDTTTQQYAHFKLSFGQITNLGTVTFKPYWTNTAGLTTETVVFSLAGAAISNDEVLNTTFGTAQTSTDTWLAQNDLHIGPESSAITIGGTPADDDLVVFEVSRVVASDNLTGDARLIGLMLYVTTDSFNEV